jgi:hypothetical protein
MVSSAEMTKLGNHGMVSDGNTAEGIEGYMITYPYVVSKLKFPGICNSYRWTNNGRTPNLCSKKP